MKGFVRSNSWFSLCGLNCGLCPLRLGGHCGGCGENGHSCAIARCSLEQGGLEYCCECVRYPCERYKRFDDFDSFITHQNRAADMEKAQRTGVPAYTLEQQEKRRILDQLLERYNDGRRKSFFCLAINLLELSSLRGALEQADQNAGLSAQPLKERSAFVVELLRRAAEEQGVSLKLRRKK